MTNGSWLIQWSAFSLLAISLSELPVAASDASSVTKKVPQATSEMVVLRRIPMLDMYQIVRLPSMLRKHTRDLQKRDALVVNRPILRIGSQGAEVSELQAALKLLGYYSGAVDGFYGETTAIAVSRFQQASGLSPDGVTGFATWDRLFPRTLEAQTPYPTPSTNSASAFPVPSTIQTTTSDSRVSGVGRSPNTIPVVGERTRHSSSNRLQPRNRSSSNATNSSTALNPQPTAVALPILRQGMQGPAVAHLQQRLRALGFFKDSVDGVFGAATQAAVKKAQQSFKLEPDGIVGSGTWSALLR